LNYIITPRELKSKAFVCVLATPCARSQHNTFCVQAGPRKVNTNRCLIIDPEVSKQAQLYLDHNVIALSSAFYIVSVKIDAEIFSRSVHSMSALCFLKLLLLGLQLLVDFGLLRDSLPFFFIHSHLTPVLGLHFPQICSDITLPT
jgi:hypothetical protein